MNFEEHAAKPLLAAAGIAVPESILCYTLDDVARAAAQIGAVVIKAQVPTGKRGKAGGIQLAANVAEARTAAEKILGMTIAGHTVEKVLVESQISIAQEFYAAILNDPQSKSPLLLFSAEGGMDIEELTEEHPDKLLQLPIDIRHGLDTAALQACLVQFDINGLTRPIGELLTKLYDVYRDNDAELVEINPLCLTKNNELIALDCKFTLEDSGAARRAELAQQATPDKLTELELRAREHGLKFIELDGEVAILANGAGLTMTTMDAVRHYGGQPANFLEIGGEAYTLGKPALELVLANPRVKSLLVNFCGAFARTDVMTGGILEAWDAVKPEVPVFFTIHGTGEDEAIAMVKDKLGIEPFDLMDDAVKAAVEAAR